MFKKIFSIFFIFLFLSSISIAKDKIDETIDKTTDFLKSISKKSLSKSQTAEFLNKIYFLFLRSFFSFLFSLNESLGFFITLESLNDFPLYLFDIILI